MKMESDRLCQSHNMKLLENKNKSLTLTWKNINVRRDRIVENNFWLQKIESVEILNNVSGMANSGRLMAIMGPSGAGKTSLLATISSRNSFSAGGSLKLDGVPVTASFMAANSGFAPQQDLVFENLTVLEHLTFMAVMKMDPKEPEDHRQQRIKQLLMEFGVADCSGSQLKSVSGGEMKRLTLCVELLNDPPILFCDEPTTGLDSWVASSVIGMLRALAQTGKMVICSIHQPASGIFEQFHDVLLLANGRTAFHGPTADAALFLGELDFRCPDNFNKAEYFISLLSVSNDQKLETNNTAMIICDEFCASRYCFNLLLNIENNQNFFNTLARGSGELPKRENLSIIRLGQLRQFRWLLWRRLIINNRSNPMKYDIFIVIGIALTIVLPVLNVTSQLNQQSIQNLEGLLYMTVTDVVFTQITSVANVFPSERSKMLREIANGLYGPAPYYASSVISLILPASKNAICFGTIIFWIASLRGGFTGFISFLGVLTMAANAATAYGLVLCASFETIQSSYLLNVPFQQVSLLFSGFFVNLRSISVYIKWLKYTSIFYYGVENLSILQWTQVESIACSDGEQPCIRDGSGVLLKYDYNVDNFYFNFLWMLIFFIVCNLVGYMMIYWKSRKQAVY